MGNLILYNGREIGDVAKRRWQAMRSLLDALLEYVNAAMSEEWKSGVARNVAVYPDRTVPAILPSSDSGPPRIGAFRLDRIFDDQSDGVDEITLLDADELHRLYAWCDYLAARDGAFELFRPLVTALKEKTAGIARP